MRKRAYVVLLIIIISCIAPALSNAETLQGIILNENNDPIPGLTVYLVSAVAGRSAPITTDVYGRFYFTSIPSVQSVYYLEVYWGSTLLYRELVTVGGPFLQRIITLKQ
jgi:hypothetical protein